MCSMDVYERRNPSSPLEVFVKDMTHALKDDSDTLNYGKKKKVQAGVVLDYLQSQIKVMICYKFNRLVSCCV